MNSVHVNFTTQNVENQCEWFEFLMTDEQSFSFESIMDPKQFLIVVGDRLGANQYVIDPGVHCMPNVFPKCPCHDTLECRGAITVPLL